MGRRWVGCCVGERGCRGRDRMGDGCIGLCGGD